ncbi:hypothetical protein KQI84_05010 [bacterium]|nr:hypothetical protein [bacterium]
MTTSYEDLPAVSEESTKLNLNLSLSEDGPDTLRIPAGERVTLSLFNTSDETLEMAAGHNAFADASDFEDALFEAPNMQTTAIGMTAGTRRAKVKLEPGQQGTMQFTLPFEKRGRWQMVIFRPGRFSAGRHVNVIVD